VIPASLMFFASGAAGLIFEVVWFYRCGLAFGNSIWATTIVLSSFMGGLALGGALAGLLGGRIRRPFRVYAALELVVAASGLGLSYLLVHVTGLTAGTSAILALSTPAVNALRLGTAFVLLLVPATAMGATLPVLAGAVSTRQRDFGLVLGRLYGLNTLGAVTGVLAAELWLIGHVGITGSAWAAALINVAVATAAIVLARRADERALPVTDSVPDSATIERYGRAGLMACAFLAGAILMALEVVWSRFLSMFVVASTLSISLTLAVVLSGIGVGGLLAAGWLRHGGDPARAVPMAAFASACAVTLSYVSFQWLTSPPWAAEWYRIVWFAIVLTLPASILSAVLFTTIGAAFKRRDDPATPALGWLTLANTTGAMLGPLAAAFILVPRAGMEKSLFALSAGYFAIGLVAVAALLRRGQRRTSMPVLALPALAAAGLLAAFPFGLITRTYFPRTAAEYTSDGSTIVAAREGPSTTILLLARTWLGKPLYHRLVTDGFSMSGTHTTAKRYMRYFAYWPMLLHDGPIRNVLVLCYGVGITAAAAATLPDVESIDVVEISPEIVAMSDLIYPPEEHPLHGDRVRVHVEDARFYLQATDRRFDLITGEPPPPLTPGTVNLYTREYFQLVHDRLSDGGMATYWLPIARRGEYDVKAIIRAFCAVFEDCSLWNGTVFDWMLAGTRRAGGPVTESRFASAWSDVNVWPRLREIGLEQPEQIGATFLGDAPYLQRLASMTPPITDNRPRRLQPAADRLSILRQQPQVEQAVGDFVREVVDPDRARKAFADSELIRRLWPPALIERTLPYFDLQRLLNTTMFEGANPLRHIEDLHAVLSRTSLRRLPLWMLGSDDAQQQAADGGNDGSGTVEYVLGIRALVARQYETAATFFADSERRGLRTPTVRPLLVYALCSAGLVDTARQLRPAVTSPTEDEQHFWGFVARTFALDPMPETGHSAPASR
jgi:predicted membrane-bound spermidine synthase